MSAMRDSANLRFSKPIDGTKNGQPRKKVQGRRAQKKEGYAVKADPRIMRAAKAAKREGEKIYPVSETEVWLR